MTEVNGPTGPSEDDIDQAAWELRERLALASARRILTEMASHDKLNDDSYHDAVIDTARAWIKMYG